MLFEKSISIKLPIPLFSFVFFFNFWAKKLWHKSAGFIIDSSEFMYATRWKPYDSSLKVIMALYSIYACLPSIQKSRDCFIAPILSVFLLIKSVFYISLFLCFLSYLANINISSPLLDLNLLDVPNKRSSHKVSTLAAVLYLS